MWKKIHTARPFSKMLARKMMRYSTGKTIVVNSLCVAFPGTPAVELGEVLLSRLRGSSVGMRENQV